jgi:hypothetical protein
MEVSRLQRRSGPVITAAAVSTVAVTRGRPASVVVSPGRSSLCRDSGRGRTGVCVLRPAVGGAGAQHVGVQAEHAEHPAARRQLVLGVAQYRDDLRVRAAHGSAVDRDEPDVEGQASLEVGLEVLQNCNVEVASQRDPSFTRSFECRPDRTGTETRAAHSISVTTGWGDLDRSTAN